MDWHNITPEQFLQIALIVIGSISILLFLLQRDHKDF